MLEEKRYTIAELKRLNRLKEDDNKATWELN
jgi:hypothetical protein